MFFWGMIAYEFRWHIACILICLLIGFTWEYYQYELAREYFPGMTFWQFVVLGDKIRITP